MKLNKSFRRDYKNENLKIGGKTVADWQTAIETFLYPKFDREVNIDTVLIIMSDSDETLFITLTEPNFRHAIIDISIKNTGVKFHEVVLFDGDAEMFSEFFQFAICFKQYLENFMVL